MYIKDINTYFRHNLTKVCNIWVQITSISTNIGANVAFIHVHYIIACKYSYF